MSVKFLTTPLVWQWRKAHSSFTLES